MKRIALIALLLPALAAAADIQPFQAQDVKPYRADGVAPQPAEVVKPAGGSQVQPRHTGGDIQPFQAQQTQRITREEMDRASRATKEEARRIARQRGAATTQQQLYWQRQQMHRQTEAANPDVTYRGR